jgi:hypothetical protein
MKAHVPEVLQTHPRGHHEGIKRCNSQCAQPHDPPRAARTCSGWRSQRSPSHAAACVPQSNAATRKSFDAATLVATSWTTPTTCGCGAAGEWKCTRRTNVADVGRWSAVTSATCLSPLYGCSASATGKVAGVLVLRLPGCSAGGHHRAVLIDKPS